MKYKGFILYFLANEAGAVTMSMTGTRPPSTMIYAASGSVLFIGLLMILNWLGMFRGLKFRHWLFIMICVVIALAAGYWYASISNG